MSWFDSYSYSSFIMEAYH